MRKSFGIFIALLLFLKNANAGPIGIGVCYAGCSGEIFACYGLAAVTYSSVPAAMIEARPALKKCNDTFWTCVSACSTMFVNQLRELGLHEQYPYD